MAWLMAVWCCWYLDCVSCVGKEFIISLFVISFFFLNDIECGILSNGPITNPSLAYFPCRVYMVWGFERGCLEVFLCLDGNNLWSYPCEIWQAANCLEDLLELWQGRLPCCCASPSVGMVWLWGWFWHEHFHRSHLGCGSKKIAVWVIKVAHHPVSLEEDWLSMLIDSLHHGDSNMHVHVHRRGDDGRRSCNGC